MHQRIQIDVDLENDDTATVATAALNHRGHDFSAAGSARRSPTDRPLAMIGEELAVARALSNLSLLLMESAQAKIARFAPRPPIRLNAVGEDNNHSR